MVRVVFVETRFGRGVEAEARGGAYLLDICDDNHAPVPFSCRDASCGTCLVRVSRGLDLLDTPSEAECLVLETLGAPADHRLACQAKIIKNNGLLELRLGKLATTEEG